VAELGDTLFVPRSNVRTNVGKAAAGSGLGFRRACCLFALRS
jgi:hypothetical protein